MKKVVLFLILFFISFNVYAFDTVKLNKCIDGDTASFTLKKKVIKVRFLAINTPEYTKEKEAYGKEASFFTCNKLKNATTIELEYDNNSDKLDKYGRTLAWVFVDNNLLQEALIEKGLAKVDYLYGDYKYTPILQEKQLLAQQKGLNMWSDLKVNYTLEIIILSILIIIVTILIIIDKKYRKKMLNNVKKKVRKKIKKDINN